MLSRFWKGRAERDRRMIMEQLEERIVMDAAVEPVPQPDPFHSGHHAVMGDGESSALLPHHSPFPAESVSGSLGHPTSALRSAAALSHVFDKSLDVLLVSDALPGSKEIANAAAVHTKIVYYSPAHDDLDTINGKLADLVSYSGKRIAHLAVASHGDDGILMLGSETLDLDAAISHRMSFKDLAVNLEPHAQIQLYSCSLAGTDEGKMLVNAIATMTGADVYASTDVTGAKPHNWTLEYATYPSAPMVPILDLYKLEQVPGRLAEVLVFHLTETTVRDLE